jgi:4-hydroxy-tetrahydrodipicolinate synthase
VTANVVPGKLAALMSAWFAGDVRTAQQIHFELLEMNDAMFIETNPIPVKTALALMGRVREEFKLPLCTMSGANRERLARTLAKYGCIS